MIAPFGTKRANFGHSDKKVGVGNCLYLYAGARLARRPWVRAAWYLDRRLQGTGGRLHWPDDMRSAWHTWIQLIGEMVLDRCCRIA